MPHVIQGNRDVRMIALDDRFTHVDAVFIKGGDLGVYFDRWNDRRFERILRSLVARGAAVGTSAGAMALAQYALTGSKSVTSTQVAADAFTPMLADASDGGSGIHNDFFGFVPGVIIDTHFTQRNRFERSLGAAAKAMQDSDPARIVAIGLDERTGLAIRLNPSAALANGADERGAPAIRPNENPGRAARHTRADVIALGTVTLITATRNFPLHRTPADPLAWLNLRLDQLTDGCAFDLDTSRVTIHTEASFSP